VGFVKGIFASHVPKRYLLELEVIIEAYVREREDVVSIESRMKSFKWILICKASGIPVRFNLCSFFLVSASRNAGPGASQFTPSFGTAGVAGLWASTAHRLAHWPRPGQETKETPVGHKGQQ